MPDSLSFKQPILLVEDSEDDIFLMTMACQRTGFPHSLYVVRDGAQAIAYLSGDGEYSDRSKHPLPRLVFLDIKMPRKNGHEVLEWIRSQPQYAALPVIMMTTFTSLNDVSRAYVLGVTSYLRKGENMAEFGQAMRVVMKYWFGLDERPK